MSKIIKATTITSSSDDNYARVRLKSEGIWDESPLVMSINQLPLVKGESVFVDVSDGYENPIILGRCSDSDTKKMKPTNGSVLFQSGSEQSWIVGFVKSNKLEVHTSSNVSITIEGDKVKINAGTVVFNDGAKGGLINIADLVNWCNTHTHIILPTECATTSDPPVPVAGKTSISSSKLMQSIIEDRKVQH